MKTIKGTIHYEINIEGKDWTLSYTQSAENDLASMAICRQLMEYSEQEFEQFLKTEDLSTKVKRTYKNLLTKARAAKFGLVIMSKYLMDIIDEYKAFAAEQEKTQAPQATTKEEAEAIIKMINKKTIGEA